MFRTAELGRKVSKRDFERQEPVLRQELLQIQQELREDGSFPVILVFAGVDGAGKGETVNLLNAWMDPRWIVTRAYGEPSDEERERPEFWRYWRDLPPRGRIGMFLSSWYSRPVLDRVFRKIGGAELEQRLERIVAFENALSADSAVILKFWMHLSKKAQKRRFKSLEKDPLQSWRVTKRDWEHWKLYDRFIEAAERTIMKTSTGVAPWTIVEGEDHHYRSLTVGIAVRDAVRRALEDARARRQLASLEKAGKNTEGGDAEDRTDTVGTVLETVTVLDSLDMGLSLEKPRYREELARAQAELNLLHRKALERGISTVLVFEGPDAAGKGGAIRRLTAALDARHVQVIPIAAPTDEEQAHHYLWRFWRHLSRAGRFTIFDRSWYGRVLVERVEGFASEEEWRRAYAEINDFEEQLIEHGTVLRKFWLHITKEEQLARFQAREKTPYKRWKLTEEDWRNRERWDDYAAAVNDMVEQTSTKKAPWVLVEGNDKRFARVKVITTVCEAMARVLGDGND
ncbi:MAG: polyphosphate:AMP phosphotransferase [Acidobacteria bacterium]|nr:polyphosphate:AMP phosphotransferase [Acidobacteriota bacterium]